MDLNKIDPSQRETCRLPWCQECAGAYMILILVTMLIFFYFLILRGAYHRKNIVHRDFMNLKIFDFPLLENCCSIWPLSHFFLFFVLGVLFPDCGIPLIALGIFWEGFEVVCSRLSQFDRQAVREVRGLTAKVEYSENWWAGSAKDIVMNITGFAAGWFVAKKLGTKICIANLNSTTKWCCDKDKCIGCTEKK